MTGVSDQAVFGFLFCRYESVSDTGKERSICHEAFC